MRRLRRGGMYLRTFLPNWDDPLDTSFSRLRGGRWNPARRFGALYLSRDLHTARANAARIFDGEIATLMDLRPERRPRVMEVIVPTTPFVDAVTPSARRSLGLAPHYLPRRGWRICQRVAAHAYAQGERGVASDSAAMVALAQRGEELAVFDRSALALVRGRAIDFDVWFRGPAARRGRAFPAVPPNAPPDRSPPF